MATHKALLLLEKFGKFAIGDLTTPEPGRGELLVEIKATALNPVDYKIQKFGHPMATSYPFINGLDGAGIVEELGPNVTKVAKGDKV